VTGGLQDQCGFEYSADDYISVGTLHNKKVHSSISHGEWVEPIWSSAINLNGSVPTPYIFDDRVNDDDVANVIMKMYKIGKKKRKAKGLKGREFMLNNLSNKIMCDKMIEGIEDALKNWEPKKRFDLYKIV
jgi:putative NADPH-quinone reductase